MHSFMVKIKTPQGAVLTYPAIGAHSVAVSIDAQESAALVFGICYVSVRPLAAYAKVKH
ncbi:hypothetical protein [Burkholderia ambifaria]|jgi:hypothetical protein|uniref:hypothetical protein n=1 Tax=Burkholderia ambifaria TaxID=152480 RepID=UPI00158DA4F2|nr:hypothetical protein [Burkholderia ambifaria]